MLKYQRKSEINKGLLLLNGAGVLVVVTLAGYFASTMLTKEVISSCSGQYQRAMRLGVTTAAGAPMSAIELQSRAGIREWGVLENAQIVRIKDAPARDVIEVKLTNSKTSPEINGTPLAGIGMTWVPPGMSGAQAACLSYDVWLPPEFDFGNGGTLPGLFGGNRPDVAVPVAEAKPGFSARLVWNSLGTADPAGVMAAAPDPASPGARMQSIMPGDNRTQTLAPGFKMDKGRWIHIDQEVVLNDPKTATGSYRLWIDGVLKASNLALKWRDDDRFRIGGVYSDLIYKGDKIPTLRLTPPVVGWR